MATIYCFFNIDNSQRGDYCMIDEKHIDSVTFE